MLSVHVITIYHISFPLIPSKLFSGDDNMIDNTQLITLTKNHDSIRGSVASLQQQTVAKALRWLRGEGPYPTPVSIHLDLTLRCSARCVHCKQWAWPGHKEFTGSQLKELIEIFNSWEVKTVTLGGGNPLLHNDIIPALEMLNHAGIKVGIISEGIDLTDDLGEAICRYAQWIRFSLDGPNPEIHDKLRNAPGLFGLVISAIKRLKSRKSSLVIGLNCVVQKGNVNHLAQMVGLARDADVDALLLKLPHGDDPSGRFLLSLEEWETFSKWVQGFAKKDTQVKTNLKELASMIGIVFKGEDIVEGRPVRSFYREGNARCFAPFFFLVCDSEGNMYPCDYLQADTRQWDGQYGNMRKGFCLGNVLEDNEGVLTRLALEMRNRVHGLPGSGFDECGCCTRFCQLNASLTTINNDLSAKPMDDEAIAQYLEQILETQRGSIFL